MLCCQMTSMRYSLEQRACSESGWRCLLSTLQVQITRGCLSFPEWCMFELNADSSSNSPTLSGAQASATGTSSKLDLRNYEMYRVGAIQELWRQREGTSLKTEEDCRMAMILIALLAGGDYAPEGVANIGKSSPTHAIQLTDGARSNHRTWSCACWSGRLSPSIRLQAVRLPSIPRCCS